MVLKYGKFRPAVSNETILGKTIQEFTLTKVALVQNITDITLLLD